MTDSSANPRNYGERPLHEDDPLMELSRIMDFGASADTNVAQNDYRGDYRPEPNFDSGDSELSFDLERELLGDFGNEPEPQQYTVPFSSNSYQDEAPVLHEDHLASALEEEFDLQMDAHEPAAQPVAPAQSFEFVEADRAEPVPQFDYNDYSEARTAYEDIHPDAYAATAAAAPLEQNYSNYESPEFQEPESQFADPYADEAAGYATPSQNIDNEWEIPSVAPFEAPQPVEPPHQALSLEDELESLLFGEEAQASSAPELVYQPAYQDESQQFENDAPRFESNVAEEPAYEEPAFDDFSLEDPQAFAPVEPATSYAPESYAPQTASRADAPAYPHYTLSNFAAGAATAGVLSSEPVQHAAPAFESDQSELGDDFSFGDDFSLSDEPDFARAVSESTDDDQSGLEEISFSEDDFGFEPSGDAASAAPDDASAVFTEEDFFTDEDFDLSPDEDEEPVSQPAYAHATYSDEDRHPSAPSFTNYADQRSIFAAPAPEIETLSVSEGKVDQTHSLDLPEVSYGDEDAGASLNDLEAEFAEVFSTIDVDESAAKVEVQSEADKAFEDIFRESASSYMPSGGVAAGAALGLGAAAATVAYGRANPTIPSATPQNAAANSDDFYNHWAAQGAQTMEGGEFGTRAGGMQPEDDLGVAAEAYRNRPVRGRRGLILASVAGLAVLIGGIGYHFLGGSGSGEPVVIRADNQPIKMQPENPGGATVPNQDKAVYDRVAGTLPNNPEQKSLISAGEEPVDLGAQDNDVGMDDAPELNTAAASHSGQEAPLIQPREVETMIVRPDGSIVQAQQPTQTAPQPTAPVAATNNDAPIAPPAETDEIGALAAAGELQPSVANTQTAQPVTQAPAAPVRAPVIPSRPAEQPTTIVGNVPQRTQTPAQAAAVAAPQVASAAGGGYFIQIASQPSAELAQKSYANMAQRYGSVIGGRAVDIKRADIPNKGTYYRVRVQAGSKEEANALCGRFKTAGGSCFVTQ
ncbi:SPOR domain-containing protein [Brucella pseudogrignonensis]|uniref:SPOR domain-containing protein n=1 Tax=Brucella pseudogrignonensis TaxID=419475 RepID=UPI003D967DBC